MRTRHRKTSLTRYLLAVVLAAPCMTQVSAADQPAPQSPYAGQQTRQIKALSEAETGNVGSDQRKPNTMNQLTDIKS